MRRKVNRLFKISKISKRDRDIDKFASLRNDYIRQCKLAHDNYLLELENKINNPEFTSSRSWWEIIRPFLKKQTKNPIRNINCGNKILSDEHQIASVLNDTFIANSTIDNEHDHIPENNIEFNIESLSNIEITEQDVIDAIGTLKSNKASGPDEISPRMLKLTCEAIASPISKLFNKSIELCTVPKEWKKANIVPVFKKGDPTLPGNYRPISLISCVGENHGKVAF
jgi:hypothetical protein